MGNSLAPFSQTEELPNHYRSALQEEAGVNWSIRAGRIAWVSLSLLHYSAKYLWPGQCCETVGLSWGGGTPHLISPQFPSPCWLSQRDCHPIHQSLGDHDGDNLVHHHPRHHDRKRLPTLHWDLWSDRLVGFCQFSFVLPSTSTSVWNPSFAFRRLCTLSHEKRTKGIDAGFPLVRFRTPMQCNALRWRCLYKWTIPADFLLLKSACCFTSYFFLIW